MEPRTDDLRSALAGFWRTNVALVQLLALCPVLAVTTTAVNGLALGLATAAVLLVTSALVSVCRGALLPSVRLPLTLLVLASLVTCVDLLSNAVLDDLHERLGLFIPLIITNSGILAQAENVASRRPFIESVVSAAATGLGFIGVLVALGLLRELFGHGTVFAGLPLLAGAEDGWPGLTVPVHGVLVAILPPGAFFGMAALLALKNHFDRAAAAPRPAVESDTR
jgi:H+/Na+-translocating ferredoxin:NAD+ oxidoreductase subunit E